MKPPAKPKPTRPFRRSVGWSVIGLASLSICASCVCLPVLTPLAAFLVDWATEDNSAHWKGQTLHAWIQQADDLEIEERHEAITQLSEILHHGLMSEPR